jgi:hypothetical protein
MSGKHKVAQLCAISFALLVAMFSFFSNANASAVYGTSAGTSIIAVSSNLIIEYQDTNNNPQPTVTGDITLTDTVSAIYGLGLSALSSLENIPASASAVFTFTATNKSNTGTTINFALNDYYVLPIISYSDTIRKGPAEWEVSTFNSGIRTYFVNEDAVAVVTMSVTVNAAARDGVVGYVTMNAFLDSSATPNGNYTGLNGTSYGGVSHDAVVISAVAGAPEIIIVTKNVANIIAPTINGYTGNETDLVPGAKMVYQIVIRNAGAVTANITDIHQNIPNNTEFLGTTLIATAPGLTPYLPNEFVPPPSYSYTVGYFIPDDPATPNVGLYGLDVSSNINTLATKLRWFIRDIPPNTPVTLSYTVVVK